MGRETPAGAQTVWTKLDEWVAIPDAGYEIALHRDDTMRHGEDGPEFPTRYRETPAPGGSPNLHVALATTLKMRTQETDAKLLAEVERMRTRLAELEAQNEGLVVHKQSYPCGCVVIEPQREHIHYNGACTMAHPLGAL